MKTQLCHTTMKAVGDRTMSFTISTAATDRDNDTIDPQGWDVANYMRNPIVLWAHDYSQPPIAKATSLHTDAFGLQATVQFPPAGLYTFADTIHDLCKAGFINATSVGFAVRESDPKGNGGYAITKQELLEFSLVTVPSNPQALVQRRSLDMQAMKSWFGNDANAIDWDRINATASEFDLGALLSTKGNNIEIDVTEDDVRRVVATMTPVLKAGLLAGLQVQAAQATHQAFCRMTGRLD